MLAGLLDPAAAGGPGAVVVSAVAGLAGVGYLGLVCPLRRDCGGPTLCSGRLPLADLTVGGCTMPDYEASTSRHYSVTPWSGDRGGRHHCRRRRARARLELRLVPPLEPCGSRRQAGS